MANSDVDMLTSSQSWSATPDNYSSMRYLQFQPDGSGIALYGYGQTIYAKINFEYRIDNGDQLTLDYQQSDPFQRFAGFTPDGPNASKLLGYTLDQSEFMFGEDVTAAKFKFSAKLVLSDSPYPAGLEFPYSIPTEFYGFRERIETET